MKRVVGDKTGRSSTGAVSGGRGNLLVVAYACDPGIPSEPYIGWSFARSALLATRDSGQVVHVLTNRRSAEASAALLTQDFGDRALVHSVGMPSGLGWLEKPRLGALARAEYLVWWFRARQYLRRHALDWNLELAHHATFATEMLPTPISVLPSDVYRVWGPIGSAGNEDIYGLDPQVPGMRWEASKQRLRNRLSGFCITLFGRNIDTFVTQTRGLSDQLSLSSRHSTIFPNVILELDAEAGKNHPLPTHGSISAPTILGAGHFIQRKRFDIAVQLLTHPSMQSATLVLIGAEPAGGNAELLELAVRLGVQDRVRFLGKVSRDSVINAMADSDVLLHPSAREGAPGVIGEAISMGLPVVCFNGTGATQLVESVAGSGIVVDASRESADALASAVLAAVAMRRPPAAVWNLDRFIAFSAGMAEEAHYRACRAEAK